MGTSKKRTDSAPHDTLVREHFQHPENALGLIRAGLPDAMFAQLRPETLRSKGIHLSTQGLLKSVTDLVFTCELCDGSEAFVHIVLEHKSHPDALVAVQVLKYMALIWDHYRRKDPGMVSLPFVIPLIFYHGQERWEPRPLTAFFPQGSPLLACVPRFEIPVCNLHNVSEERLRGDLMQNAMLLLLKALLNKESVADIARLLHLLHETYTNPNISDTLALFFNYLAYIRPEITLDAIDEALAKLPGGTDMLGRTFKEQWADYSYAKGAQFGREEGLLIGEARGEARGEVRGEARGVRTTILELLAMRFVNVPPALVEKLDSLHDVATLRPLVPTVLQADSLKAFEAVVDTALGLQ